MAYWLLGRDQTAAPGDFWVGNAIGSRIGTEVARKRVSAQRNSCCERDWPGWSLWTELGIEIPQQRNAAGDLPYRPNGRMNFWRGFPDCSTEQHSAGGISRVPPNHAHRVFKEQMDHGQATGLTQRP
jgi:hypothetical protein